MTAAPAMHRWRVAGLIFIFLWFAIGGVAHFVATDAEMRIVPPWIPWPRETVWVSGAFELLGAAGLLWRPTRRAAGIGLFLLTLAVLFSTMPYWALVRRRSVRAD